MFPFRLAPLPPCRLTKRQSRSSCLIVIACDGSVQTGITAPLISKSNRDRFSGTARP
jgi:hypothetical protein